MVEVFTTNIPNNEQGLHMIKKLKIIFPHSKIHFDIELEISNYPCTHSILRFEDRYISTEIIQRLVEGEGFKCDVLLDKVCNS